MIVLTIPDLSPSLNVTRKGHWTSRHRRRKHWSMLVLVAKSEAKTFHVKPFPRARVTIERHGGKAMDQDNLAGGAKDLVDGLCDNGFIVDDDPAHLDLRFEQYPGVRKQSRTIIRIEAV
jgi:hypothetical protein